jgi:integrase
MNRAPSITPEEKEAVVGFLKEPYRLIFELSCVTGLRISDILALRGSNLDSRGILTTIESKTRKIKSVEVYGDVLERLQERARKSNVYLFRSSKSPKKHIHRVTVYRALQKITDKHGIKITPHTARHFYARQILKSTGDIDEVRRKLNHDDIGSTATYLGVDLKALLNAALNSPS